ncbi:MAG: type III restriction enzyme [Vicingaceae bacterium]
MSDSIPKLRGFAKYAEKHQGLFRRIESIAEVDGKFRALDLTSQEVRDKVFDATEPKLLFRSDVAKDYTK